MSQQTLILNWLFVSNNWVLDASNMISLIGMVILLNSLNSIKSRETVFFLLS